MKCILVDGKVAYSGGANFTGASKTNLEVMCRFTGHPVTDLAWIMQDALRSAVTTEL